MWLKNTDGQQDAVLTMTFIGFLVIIAKILLSGVVIGTFSFGSIDPMIIGAVLGPTLGAYIARRYTDRKFDTTVTPEKGVLKE